MRDDLCALLADADTDDTVEVVVLTAVDPVFSAGVDFKEVADAGSVPERESGSAPNGEPAPAPGRCRPPIPARRCGAWTRR